MKVMDYVYGFIAGILMSVLPIWAFIQYTDTPEVHFSYSEQKCVRVVYPDGKITDCSVLPDKYEHIWIK